MTQENKSCFINFSRNSAYSDVDSYFVSMWHLIEGAWNQRKEDIESLFWSFLGKLGTSRWLFLSVCNVSLWKKFRDSALPFLSEVVFSKYLKEKEEIRHFRLFFHIYLELHPKIMLGHTDAAICFQFFCSIWNIIKLNYEMGWSHTELLRVEIFQFQKSNAGLPKTTRLRSKVLSLRRLLTSI